MLVVSIINNNNKLRIYIAPNPYSSALRSLIVFKADLNVSKVSISLNSRGKAFYKTGAAFEKVL